MSLNNLFVTTRRQGGLGRLQVVCLIGMWGAPLLMAAPQKGSEGIYTVEQAARGKDDYVNRCAVCHGTTLEGTTAGPLVGPGFARRWGAGGAVSGSVAGN